MGFYLVERGNKDVYYFVTVGHNFAIGGPVDIPGSSRAPADSNSSLPAGTLILQPVLSDLRNQIMGLQEEVGESKKKVHDADYAYRMFAKMILQMQLDEAQDRLERHSALLLGSSL